MFKQQNKQNKKYEKTLNNLDHNTIKLKELNSKNFAHIKEKFVQIDSNGYYNSWYIKCICLQMRKIKITTN